MRIELLNEKQLGQGAAMYQGGWRLAFLCTQVLTFLIASRFDWSVAYTVAAITMAIVAGITVLLVPEPPEMERDHVSLLNNPRVWFQTSYVNPFLDIAKRYKSHIYLILLLVMSYRFSDLILGPMAMPFYIETGFSKEEIAMITNAFGISVSLAGAFIGGLLVYRYSTIVALTLGAVLVALTNLTFAALDIIGNNTLALTLVIICDNLAQGVATAALIAYLSSLTIEKFTATQYALLFLLATLPARFIGSSSGLVVDAVGYFNFFIYAALMGIPAILISVYFLKEEKASEV
jgi:PAT family beta-lactamase induction signal transducer AmpG